MSSKVYFFGTCLLNMFQSEVISSAINILKLLGMDVVYPSKQTCCGNLALLRGGSNEATKLVSYFLKLFPEDLPIIVLSTSCAKMLKEADEFLDLKEADRERLLKIKNNIYEWSYFIMQNTNCNFSSIGKQVKIAWHCCNTSNLIELENPIRFLDLIDGVECINHTNRIEPCGARESFFTDYPEIADNLAKNIIQSIEKAEFLVGLDYSCLLHLSTTMKKYNINLEAMHLAQFVWQMIKK